MNVRVKIGLVAATVLGGFLLPASFAGPLMGSRPNVIFVLTDDQGMGDRSCMENEILRTPQIDAFYKKSTRFTDFHVSPTCAPTRAALMSGRHLFEVGVSHTIAQRERMALDVVTFPQALSIGRGTIGNWSEPFIGKGASSSPVRNFVGKIDDLSIWKTALSDQEILEAYRNTRP